MESFKKITIPGAFNIYGKPKFTLSNYIFQNIYCKWKYSIILALDAYK